MADKTPLVSVGMPVFNGERHLPETLESILGQSVEDLELIISDNASTDGTQELCQSFAARDARVRYVRQATNVGASENYNFVFRNARSKYFKWASSNDICHRDFLAKCLAPLRQRPDVVLCYPRTRLFTDDPADGEDYYDNIDLSDDSPCQRFAQITRQMGLNNAMNGVIRSDALRKTMMVKPYYSSDLVLMAELVLHGKFLEIPECLFYRRMDDASSTLLRSEKEVVKHYYPNKQSKMLFQHWKIHLGYLWVALASPLGLRERACVIRAVLRNAWWARRRLLTELRVRGA